MRILKTAFLYLDCVWMVIIIMNNFSTIAIVICNKNLRTVINDFLLSLFTANLLYGFSVVFTLLSESFSALARKNEYLCLLHFATLLTPALGILYSLIAITADRYISVFYPLRYLDIMKPRIIKITIALIWTASVATGCLPMFWINSGELKRRTFECSFAKIIPDNFVWTCVVPPALTTIVVILFTYLKIWCLQRQRQRKVACVSTMVVNNIDGDSKTTMTVSIIIFSSIFALTPFFVVAVLVKAKVNVAPWLGFATYELSFINPMFTPIIFAWRTEIFRNSIKKLLKWNTESRNLPIIRRRSEVTEISVLASTSVFPEEKCFADSY